MSLGGAGSLGRQGPDWEEQGAMWGAAWLPSKGLRERRQGSRSPSPARPASQGHRVGPWRGQGLLEKYSLAIC